MDLKERVYGSEMKITFLALVKVSCQIFPNNRLDIATGSTINTSTQSHISSAGFYTLMLREQTRQG